MKNCIKKRELICLLIFNFPEHKAGNIELLYQDLCDKGIKKNVLFKASKIIKKYIPVIEKHVKEPTSVNIVKYGLDCFYLTGWNGNELSESRMKVIFEILKQHLSSKYKPLKKQSHTNKVICPSWIYDNQINHLSYYQASDFSLERCIIKKLVSINILESVYKV